MAEHKSKPTIEDVAKHCGVSVATVSRVINRSTPVSKELDRKVRKAIKKLDFTPRQWTARPKAETIALMIPNILNPFYAEIIQGAQEEADRHEMNLVILNVSPTPKHQKQYMDWLAQTTFDGLVVVGSRVLTDHFVELYEQQHIPIVATIRAVDLPQLPCIVFDYETSTAQITKYLLNLNHTRLAYISGPPDWYSSRARLEGIQRTLAEAGYLLPSSLHQWCFPNIENGIQAVKRLLALPKEERPTAIIAFNDLVAIGALHAIRASNLDVPRDISVTGFDDITMAAYTNPPLTTIAQPKYRMGQLAVQKLAELISGNASVSGGFTVLECPLIVRESTAPRPE